MDYAECTTKEAKQEAIEAASTVEELEEMWECWEECGWSKEGLMYARVLERKGEIDKLTKKEEEVIKRAAAKRRHGEGLPAVEGEMK